jgi:hypothetical protein
MRPRVPTANATFSSTADTACRLVVTGEACWVQVAPPLRVRRIVPPSPTAQPVFSSTMSTLHNRTLTPVAAGVHVAPASVARTDAPLPPTAPSTVGEPAATENSDSVVLDVREVQVAPPSVVVRIDACQVPPRSTCPPTVTALLADSATMSWSVVESLVPSRTTAQVVPSGVRATVPLPPASQTDPSDGAATESNSGDAPGLRRVQLVPPLSDFISVPRTPAA